MHKSLLCNHSNLAETHVSVRLFDSSCVAKDFRSSKTSHVIDSTPVVSTGQWEINPCIYLIVRWACCAAGWPLMRVDCCLDEWEVKGLPMEQCSREHRNNCVYTDWAQASPFGCLCESVWSADLMTGLLLACGDCGVVLYDTVAVELSHGNNKEVCSKIFLSQIINRTFRVFLKFYHQL